MTKEEVNKRNEAIAIFMGGKLSKPKNPINSPYWKIPRHNTYLGNPNKVYILYYDRFWDWIMPVIEEIEKPGSIWLVEIGFNACKIFNLMNLNNSTDAEYSRIGIHKRQAVFLAVSDYCINYNKKNNEL